MGKQTDRPLLELLRDYAASPAVPLHMPGHKRNTALLGEELPYAFDITEIDGFDNLHEAQGVLANGMARAAALYGSGRAFYLVAGSTAGILAGIRAATRPGDRVMVARNCHRSVYHALELCRLRPCYLTPPAIEGAGICGSIPVDQARKQLEECPDSRLVVVTSPTYEGVLSDVEGLARLCHERGIPLMVDEAHGAHLGWEPFPSGAVAAGADLVVHSLHKTLPSLTQTGLLHVSGRRIDPLEVERQLAVFQTSSPSYPLMASIDRCVRLMAGTGNQWMKDYAGRLARFDCRTASLRHLSIFGHTGKLPSEAFGFDPGKLLICCRGIILGASPLTGGRLADILRRDYRIEIEMASAAGVLAMTSLCDSDKTFERLAQALADIDNACAFQPKGLGTEQPLPPVPEQILPMEEALGAFHAFLPLEQCEGSVSAEYVWAYPPGVPLLAPGEKITDDFIRFVRRTIEQGVALHSTARRLPDALRVCASPTKG